ncbi:MAG: hypothetical protein HPZ91_00030 [Lentisphaeria bacterium]|nr:hypothetical protein [Lentisphaeria bacterium]
MAVTVYDDYGRTQDDPYFGQKSEVPEPYMVDLTNTDVTYICFTDAPARCIRRISRNGRVTVTEFAVGAWENRASLTYQPVNTKLEVAE